MNMEAYDEEEDHLGDKLTKIKSTLEKSIYSRLDSIVDVFEQVRQSI